MMSKKLRKGETIDIEKDGLDKIHLLPRERPLLCARRPAERPLQGVECVHRPPSLRSAE